MNTDVENEIVEDLEEEESTDSPDVTDEDSDLGVEKEENRLWLLAIPALLLLVVVALVWLKPGSNVQTVTLPVGEAVQVDPTGYAVDVNELIQNEKHLMGEIQDVTLTSGDSAGMIVVRSHVVNIDVEEEYIEEVDVQYQEREFSIAFTDATLFENKVAKDLTQGDTVKIETNESIYLADSLVAEKVAFHDPRDEIIKQIIGDTNSFYGVVKEKTGGSMVITTEMIDKEALDEMDLSGSYSVPTTARDLEVTLNDDVDAADLAVGDVVSVVTAEDIYQGETVVAVQITVVSTEEEDASVDF